MTLGFLPCDTNVAGDRTTHFPVETIIQDDRKILVVQCPAVTIHDIRVEYDGHSHGKLQIERKEGLGVEPLHWEWKIHFDTHHEFVQSDTRRPKSWGVATRDLPLAHVKRCNGGLLAIHPLTEGYGQIKDSSSQTCFGTSLEQLCISLLNKQVNTCWGLHLEFPAVCVPVLFQV